MIWIVPIRSVCLSFKTSITSTFISVLSAWPIGCRLCCSNGYYGTTYIFNKQPHSFQNSIKSGISIIVIYHWFVWIFLFCFICLNEVISRDKCEGMWCGIFRSVWYNLNWYYMVIFFSVIILLSLYFSESSALLAVREAYPPVAGGWGGKHFHVITSSWWHIYCFTIYLLPLPR